MAGAVVTLEPILTRLQETRSRTGGLEVYIVDNSGRLVASNEPGEECGGNGYGRAFPSCKSF